MKKVTIMLLGLTCLATLSLNIMGQSSDKAIEDAVIAMAKAQWAARVQNPDNVAEQMKDVADDYTQFDPGFSVRKDGKAMNMRFAKASSIGSVRRVFDEMSNAKVQVYNGNTAILSYNYMGLDRDKDGKLTPVRIKSTRVYVKRNGKWMMVHANFAPDTSPQQ